MAFDYVVLGRKLKKARESLLIAPQESALRLQISLQEYLDIEEGRNEITGDQLVLLSVMYRRDFRYFVTGDYPSAESQVQEIFRRNAALSKSDRIAIQEFVRLCEYEDFLEREVFQRQPTKIPNYAQYQFNHSYFKRQGEEAASLERERLGLGQQPVENIFELIRNQGIHIFKRQLEDKNISGLYINHPVAGHCILINYLDDLYRQNFSAAHEYCHALFDSSEGQEVTYLKSLNARSELEWRANSFAGSFLVSKQRIESDYSPAESYEAWVRLIRQIAERFRVSSQVVIIRLSELTWLNKALQDQLIQEKRLVIKHDEKFDPETPPTLSSGMRSKSAQIIRQGLSWHFIDLCTEAYRRGEITHHKLLDMLLLPLEDGYQLLNELLTFLEVSS
ncbi:MAG: ImmA/IrrE family metallo-endopeptidase [Microcystis sp.]|uniref:ImmA/IrrE family metallo-endopeptidase n=1 Tax=Microcystis sp. TaxID=1127 RepID=UPI0022BBBE57|nr:ImmA/IrrE family metallo-endopeptidase [Microcystis sp. LE17-20D]MCZ8065690.1 ImmA/IrrE family metallo-endopeptidase [Microcystis sp. LE17-20D]MCZ8159299.1 ImmA/IrrE family metallo-endopeptidase [Microcystis sp. LE19-196.1B]MCZ8272259.1 ImmA/IrrE family metallo-endopeptidase [Microcystis sp. LE19-4.1E]